MEIIKEDYLLRNKLKELKYKGKKIGFVPTMGALHEGHISLIKKARKDNDIVVVSIFVNPIQFNDKNDYLQYPRDIKRDENILDDMGVSLLFSPSEREIYPAGSLLVFVDVIKLDNELCGKYRKGHFKGVVSVVSKLFNIIQPDIAVFGKKDIQQAIIIKKMVDDLNYPIKILLGETIREKEGLAISSRNVRLTKKAREEAPSLYKSLKLALKSYKKGEKNSNVLTNIVRQYILTNSPIAKIEYIDIVDANTLQKKEVVDVGDILAPAVYYKNVRLIDNIILE